MRPLVDTSVEFWPTGWMVWFCWVVGALDVGLIGTVVHSVMTRGVH